MYKHCINFVVVIIAIAGCDDSNPVQSTITPEFVLNTIHCTAKVYYRNDTVIATQLNYGLDAHFRNTYGRVTKQIFNINGFIDSTDLSSVPETPDPINPPVWSIQINIPNILGNADSVKLYEKIFGIFFTDSTKQSINGNFYRFDSVTIRIQHIYVDLPANQRFPEAPKGQVVPLGLAAVR
jgi:hypothetical protein